MALRDWLDIATLATPATVEGETSRSVATVATVATIQEIGPQDSDPAESEPDPHMRACRQCLNLSPGGRCLAAWRGESFGAGIAVRRDFASLDPDRPQRCLPYRPGPDEPDRRTGSERWPWLI